MKKSVAALPYIYIISFVCALFLLIQACPVKTYAGEEISVNTSQGDTVSVFGDIDIHKATSGDVVVILGNVDIKEEVHGDVVAIFGDIKVDAKVSGDVCGFFGNVALTERANIGGDLFTLGTLQKAYGAKLGGQEIKINMGVLALARAALTVVLSFLALVLGLAMITISRERFRQISAVVEENMGRKLLTGFVGMVGATILMILLMVTVVAPLIYVILLLVAEITASIYFGKQMLKVFDLKLGTFLEFVTGLLFITLVKVALTLAVPQHSFPVYLLLYMLFGLLVNSLGIGILIESKFGACAPINKIQGMGLDTAAELGYNRSKGFDSLDPDLRLGGSRDEDKV